MAFGFVGPLTFFCGLASSVFCVLAAEALALADFFEAFESSCGFGFEAFEAFESSCGFGEAFESCGDAVALALAD